MSRFGRHAYTVVPSLFFFFFHCHSGEERSASHRNPHNWRARQVHNRIRTDGAIIPVECTVISIQCGYDVGLVNYYLDPLVAL